MDIPTARTQRKIAELLHAMDGCENSGGVHPLDACGNMADYVARSAFFLGRLMPSIITEMFPVVQADERDKVAYHITAELVCCDIHARLEAEAAKGHWDEDKHQWIMPKSWKALKKSSDYHAICRYGGWAAALAFEGPKRDNRHEGWSKPWEVDPPSPETP